MERFGVDFGTHFGAVWHQNASKMRSKIDAKIDAEKVMENDAKKVENYAKIDIKSVFFQCDVLKAVFMEIHVFLQENRSFSGCGASKK